MQTKYILHGGFPLGQPSVNDEFFREILQSAPQSSKILLVYFAKEDDRIEKNRLEDVEQFTKNSGGKDLFFEVATVDNFLQQIEKSDIIYLHGGHTGLIMERMAKFTAQNLEQAFQGKIIAGDSAGTNILASAFYSIFIGAGTGKGIIPLKILCHYTEENKDSLRDLLPELETVYLKELEYKVFYT